MNLNSIVTTPHDSTHKRVFSVAGNIIAIESYPYSGMETEYVSEKHLTLVSDKPTEEFLQAKALYDKIQSSRKKEKKNVFYKFRK